MKKSSPGKNVIVLILGALITVSPFSIDMYLPAFSQIAKDLHTAPAKIAITISSYFAGLAFGQLFYGPLLDRFGRKKPLYCGLTIYIFVSVGCIFAQNLQVLVVFRFVQALGACAALVAAMAMVRDFFPPERTAKILSLLMLILGLSPLLAPTAGGLIASALGWRWVFVVLSILAVAILMVVFLYLPEGHQPDKSISLRVKPMIRAYLSIFKDSQFSTYTLAGAFSFATMFIYVAGSPIIFIENFHVTPQLYGGIFAMLSVGFVGGNQVNILLLNKYKSEQIFRFALLTQLITSVIFLAGVFNDWYGLTVIIVLFFISLSCLGLTYPNASALGLTPFTSNVGSASALLGFLQLGIAGLASACVGFFNSTDSRPVAAIMAVTTVIAVVILLAGQKKIVSKKALNFVN